MNTTRISCQLAFISIALAVTAGCSTQKTWVYHANSYPVPTASTGKKVAVLPFEDERTNINHNMALLALVPLIPYGWQNLNAPEGISMHTTSGMWLNFKPSEDFPKAVADDLKSTGLFSDAYFSYQRGGSDYAVEGTILNTKYDGYTITYCLGVYGVYLWFVGFPAGWTQNQMALDLRLADSSTGETLFSKNYSVTPKKEVSWIYDMKNDFQYADMMSEINLQFCHDIEPIVLKESLGSTNAMLK
jgi:curli biogenesis system outer membrane secretion channel CsgG